MNVCCAFKVDGLVTLRIVDAQLVWAEDFVLWVAFNRCGRAGIWLGVAVRVSWTTERDCVLVVLVGSKLEAEGLCAVLLPEAAEVCAPDAGTGCQQDRE